ncbi:hypothetical protein LAZ67_8003125 [Cordylochernes scorpioides]|uniref:Uncharacterized protein n=1 Tax=Cordylochernes scorpioides TaxID=51811 RepID=A0ABY6KSY4_9ARAC|nr:hypothetical protein LAZ67_8003125 [Cordylochernes scorpioides]
MLMLGKIEERPAMSWIEEVKKTIEKILNSKIESSSDGLASTLMLIDPNCALSKANHVEKSDSQEVKSAEVSKAGINQGVDLSRAGREKPHESNQST